MSLSTMSFRVMHRTTLSLGLMAASTLACDGGAFPEPSASPQATQSLAIPEGLAEIDAGLSIEGVCMSPLRKPVDAVNALLIIDLADADRMPQSLVAHVDDGQEMRLTDDGLDGDAYAGDARYSVAVVGPTELHGRPETCGSGADLGMTLEPFYADPAGPVSDTHAKYAGHYCEFYPDNYGDCTECGGQWRSYYYCSWWWGCYYAGHRCYGW